MNRGWILAAVLGCLVACDKSSGDASPVASAASSSAAAPSSASPPAAAAVEQAAATAQTPSADPSLAPAAEDTSDITSASYKKELDSLEKEIAALN